MQKNITLSVFFLLILCHGLLISQIHHHSIPEEKQDEKAEKKPGEVERVMVHMKNIPQGSKSIPGSNGIIEISRRRFQQQSQTLDAMASFYNVPEKSGYTVTGWNKSNSDAFDRAKELWGIWKDIEISADHYEFIFTRNMPYIYDVDFSYFQENIANPSLQVNDTLTFFIKTNNPSGDQLRAEVVLRLRNFDSGKTYQLEQNLVIKPHAYRQEVVFQFVAPEPGEYHSAPGIFIKERINEWTDCWSWSENPLFFVMNQHRVLDFAGYQWDVKAGFGNPGGNFWSGDSSDVWVDENGRLHLTLSAKNERWYATEVISRNYFGYGTYTFYLDADPGLFDSNVVAGIFLYLDEENEIDIEFSRWGDDDNYQFGNYVVQPADLPGNQFRFPIITSGSYTTHQITWLPGQIHFASWHGHYPEPLEGRIIAQWQYSGDNVPVNNGLRLFFNLWLFRGIAPNKPGSEKFVISDMNYMPARYIDLNESDDRNEQNQDVEYKP